MNLLRAIFVAATLVAAGCVSVSEGVDNMKELDTDSVLVVGKIEVVPPIKPEEQSYKANDPFNSKRHFMGRAVMFMSDKPDYREHTGHALNPPLEQVYFVKVPRSQRYMVKGSVTMAFAMRVVSRRQAVTEQTELLFPAPAELDIRPSDKAIYIGTLRLHRDEFHEVTRAEVRDEFVAANAEFKKKFGAEVTLRKALMRKPKP
jgi:hypothetical protein